MRPMRGQVVVEEVAPERSATLWTPAPGARDVRTHTGRVLALGPPARTAGGVEVSYGFGVGDLIQYHFAHHEAAWTHEWEGRKAVWVPQSSVDAVWIEGCEACDLVRPFLCTNCGAEGVLFDEDGVEVDLCEVCDGTGEL